MVLRVFGRLLCLFTFDMTGARYGSFCCCGSLDLMLDRDGSIALWDIPTQSCSRLLADVELNNSVNALLMRNESEFVAVRESGVAQVRVARVC
jgi:hypothetical protein